jgi:hypothetical protein
MERNLKREFVFISSKDRVPGSASTTDFTVKFQVPYQNVVKVDLIQATIDYRLANVHNVSFVIGTDTYTGQKIIIEDGLYTPASLATAIERSLGSLYQVNVGSNPFGVLSIYKPPVASSSTPSTIMMMPTGYGDYGGGGGGSDSIFILDQASANALGSSLNATITPTSVSGGGSLWTFPSPPTLEFTDRYLFIQSTKLGNDIRTPSNTLAYKFMLLNDPIEYTLTQVNNRVDTYEQSPRFLQDVDVRLVDGTGTVLNNYDGEFAMLLEVVSLSQ